MIEKLAPKGDVSAARSYVDLLRQRDFDELAKDMDPSVDNSDPQALFSTMASVFPAGNPASIKVIGWNFVRIDGSVTTNVLLEYEFSQQWVLVDLSTKKHDGTTSITRFYVHPLDDSIEHTNRFTLVGKALPQYAFLLLVPMALGLSFYPFVLCIRRGINRRNWPWLIAILLGACKFSVNWTTGETSFALLSITFPTAGWASMGVGPWIIYVSLPFGAAAYMLFVAMNKGSRPTGREFDPAEPPVAPKP